jgi:hypothetical protein
MESSPPESTALAPGLGERIDAMVALLPSRSNAAAVGGISADTLQRYVREESGASFEPLARLAFATGTSLDWVATGRLPRSAGLDAALLRQALGLVDEALATLAQPLSSEKRAELVTVVYDLLVISAGRLEPGLVQRLIQLAAP